MKKNLLSLALAAVVGSAFANVSVYKSENANLWVGGYVRYVYTDKEATIKTKSVKESKTTVDGAVARYRLNFGGDFRVADSTAFGFAARLQNDFYNDFYSKEKAYSTNVTTKVHKGNKTQYFYFKYANVYLANDNFGRLALGRFSTVADDAAGSDLEYLDFNTGFDYVFDTDTVKGVRYTTPTFGNFIANYSYSNNTASRKQDPIVNLNSGADRSVQNALNGIYSLSTGTTIQGTVAFQKQRLNGLNVNKAKGFQLAVAQQINPSWVVAAAYDYVRVQYKDGTAAENTVNTKKCNTFVVKTAYTLNQYFQPYAGATFQKIKDVSTDVKAYGAYLGVQSDVYKNEYVNVRLFGEGVYLHAKEKESKSKLKQLDLAAGLKVSF
ncbi:porin family protein [Psittacicella hinzii]|uniref:Porin n=1 Tax=Psittacicella hinzii TaxID=2028575 RepID=A0A3A1YA36_9GAMM|nr:hypothetical protein [Psittacicella hinzii]RIY35173.1 hypothetical protein CKF58_06980 [Psittacicella hinzii]